MQGLIIVDAAVVELQNHRCLQSNHEDNLYSEIVFHYPPTTRKHRAAHPALPLGRGAAGQDSGRLRPGFWRQQKGALTALQWDRRRDDTGSEGLDMTLAIGGIVRTCGSRPGVPTISTSVS
jgi:hypothetical protein